MTCAINGCEQVGLTYDWDVGTRVNLCANHASRSGHESDIRRDAGDPRARSEMPGRISHLTTNGTRAASKGSVPDRIPSGTHRAASGAEVGRRVPLAHPSVPLAARRP